MKSKTKSNFFFKLVLLSFLIVTLIVSLDVFTKKKFNQRSYARSNDSQCRAMGGICINENACSARGGFYVGVQDCVGNTVCCYLNGMVTITPSPTPATYNRLEYEGENIRVITECTANETINIHILDDGVDENPNGTWTYLLTPSSGYVYLAYSSPHNLNSSATVYGTAYSIRGGASEVIQGGVEYVAGIAHGYDTFSIPELYEPIYELPFTTPVCN